MPTQVSPSYPAVTDASEFGYLFRIRGRTLRTNLFMGPEARVANTTWDPAYLLQNTVFWELP